MKTFTFEFNLLIDFFKKSTLIPVKIKKTFDFNLSTAINDKGLVLNELVILLTEKYVDSNGFLLNIYNKHSFYK